MESNETKLSTDRRDAKQCRRGYFTESHQIFIQFREIIANESSEVGIAIFQAVSVRRMKVSRPISPILPIKLVVMATSLEPPETEGRISNLRLNAYHLVNILVKIGPVDPEIICLTGQLKIKNK